MKLGSPRRLKTIFRTNLRVSAAAARWQRIQDHRRPPSGRSARGLNHASRDLLAIPVVDAANQLVGVVTVDDVIDVIRDEATEDILKLAGTTAEEIHFPGVLRGAWIRFPWLGASFIGGFLGIYLLARFEGLLSQDAPDRVLPAYRAGDGRQHRQSVLHGGPVRSELPPPPTSRTNLDRDETRAGFPPGDGHATCTPSSQ